MRVILLPAGGGGDEHQYLTTFLVNDCIAIDAGCLGFHGDPRDQVRIRHIFLSHSHADHVCSLPLFVSHVVDSDSPPVTIYASEATLHSLKCDLFNGRVWPTLERLTSHRPGAVRLRAVSSGETTSVDGVSVTPVTVNHVVETFGFVVDDGKAAVVFASDSGPTEAIWLEASQRPHLRAAFVGVAFPDAKGDVAEVAGHLTPASFRRQIELLPGGAKVLAIHIKPLFRDEVVRELRALGSSNVEVAVAARAYEF